MKVVLSILIWSLLLSSYGQSQENIDQFCGSGLNSFQSEQWVQFHHLHQNRNNIYDTAWITVPIAVHIIRDDNGLLGPNLAEVQAEIDSLNAWYASAKIKFTDCVDWNFIDASGLREFDLKEEEDILTEYGEQQRVINIYFMNKLFSGSSQLCGLAYFPGGPNRIYISELCLKNGITLAHEMGHYFALEHTHGPKNDVLTFEYVDGTNCAEAGDYICDTPADPNLEGKVNSSCEYTAAEKDRKKEFFQPDVTNIMSYAPIVCMNKFTPGQYRVIRNSLFYHKRIEHFCQPEVPNESNLIAVYPNPAMDHLFIEYSLKEDAELQFVLLDPLGRETHTMFHRDEVSGFGRSFHWVSGAEFSAGIYYLMMYVNGERKQTKAIMFLDSNP